MSVTKGKVSAMSCEFKSCGLRIYLLGEEALNFILQSENLNNMTILRDYTNDIIRGTPGYLRLLVFEIDLVIGFTRFNHVDPLGIEN